MPALVDHALVALVVGAALYRAYTIVRRKSAGPGCGACPAVKKN